MIRPLVKSDFEILHQYAADPYVLATLADGFLWTIQHPAIYSNLPTYFCIEENGEPVGMICCVPGPEEKSAGAELGYWIGRKWWGKGYATRAVSEVVDKTYADIPYVECIYALPYSNNNASCRVLEKNGFDFVGRMHRSIAKGDKILDTLIYERVRKADAPN